MSIPGAVWPNPHARVGPYVHGGKIFVVMVESGEGSVFSSSDGGDTWSSAMSGQSGEVMDSQVVGDLLYVLMFDASDTMRVLTYDLSTESWGTSYNSGTTGFAGPDGKQAGLTVMDGATVEFFIAHQGPTSSVMGTAYHRVRMAHWDGSTWSTAIMPLSNQQEEMDYIYMLETRIEVQPNGNEYLWVGWGSYTSGTLFFRWCLYFAFTPGWSTNGNQFSTVAISPLGNNDVGPTYLRSGSNYIHFDRAPGISNHDTLQDSVDDDGSRHLIADTAFTESGSYAVYRSGSSLRLAFLPLGIAFSDLKEYEARFRKVITSPWGYTALSMEVRNELNENVGGLTPQNSGSSGTESVVVWKNTLYGDDDPSDEYWFDAHISLTTGGWSDPSGAFNNDGVGSAAVTSTANSDLIGKGVNVPSTSETLKGTFTWEVDRSIAGARAITTITVRHRFGDPETLSATMDINGVRVEPLSESELGILVDDGGVVTFLTQMVATSVVASPPGGPIEMEGGEGEVLGILSPIDDFTSPSAVAERIDLQWSGVDVANIYRIEKQIWTGGGSPQ